MNDASKTMNTKEKIPLFGSWKGWYLLVVLFLCGLILLFWGLTKYFA